MSHRTRALAAWTSGAAAALAGALLLAGAAAGQSGGQSLEYPVKAAYLPKLPPFVDWPGRAFAAPQSPFVICVVGPDPFGGLLDKAASGQRLGEHAIVVRRLAAASRDCHVLYLGQQNAQAVADSLKAVRGAPVLTVTDGARQPGARGIVHFVVKDARVRFVIDDQQAADNGLTISSKLMSLALSVRRRA
ncbi:MAG: putative transrane protein [Caulobacter sp.]|nr:putative transrane protein [Caulobacter sp.]